MIRRGTSVYRLSKSRFSHDLSGRGTEIGGGRWNSKGVAMLYTSESRALCTTEIAVHTPLGNVPTDYDLVTFEIPGTAIIKEVYYTDLPADWKSFPHANATQEMGNQFIAEGQYLVLKVPSAVVQGHYNYLINPYHQDFGKVKVSNIEPFEFDDGLFVK